MRPVLDLRMACGRSLSDVGRPIGMRDRHSKLFFPVCVKLHQDGGQLHSGLDSICVTTHRD